jgi:hypothetical protein
MIAQTMIQFSLTKNRSIKLSATTFVVGN